MCVLYVWTACLSYIHVHHLYYMYRTLSQTKTLVNSISRYLSSLNSFVTSLNPFTHDRPCWTLFLIPCTWHNHWTWLAGILARHAILEQDEVVQLQIPVKNCGWKRRRIESALVPRYTDHTHRQDARTKELPGFAFFSACESTATTHDTTSFPLFKHILGLEWSCLHRMKSKFCWAQYVPINSDNANKVCESMVVRNDIGAHL